MSVYQQALASARGQLLFIGDFGGQPVSLSGRVCVAQLEVQHQVQHVTSLGNPVAVHVPLGPPVIKFTAELRESSLSAEPEDDALWQVVKGMKPLPAEVQALLELARNHPDEYDNLREGLEVLRALGG